ncbi:hypothetical protein RHGRI_000783 [Rhododendron griersonianum]|uniref:Uncharacterized protein n=1 Tax=Rhododendron griersonianum TaxID=479676 RepID=A0AAV6LK40_9ERIC|nr:hypothetical protein RHGRI_000783 [Rhododendron griersonianum]
MHEVQIWLDWRMEAEMWPQVEEETWRVEVRKSLYDNKLIMLEKVDLVGSRSDGGFQQQKLSVRRGGGNGGGGGDDDDVEEVTSSSFWTFARTVTTCTRRHDPDVTAAGGREGGVPLLLELLPGAVRDREFAGQEEGGRDGGVLGGDGGTEEVSGGGRGWRCTGWSSSGDVRR